MKSSEDQGSRSGPPLPAETVSSAALFGALLKLAAVVLVALAGMGWIAHSRFGLVGFEAACWAALICGGSAAAALIGVARFTNQGAGVAGALIGIFLRTGPPLFAGVMVPQWEPRLGEAGFFPLVLGFYLVVLAAETVLSVRLVGTESGTR